MTLFDSPELRPPSRLRRYTIRALGVVITIVLFVAFFPGYLWYPFVYYGETKTVNRFMSSVVSGDMQQAYQIWKPSPSYSFKDFMDDWGPDGYYGPVRSYKIGRPEHLKNSTATDIAVDVSPYPAVSGRRSDQAEQQQDGPSLGEFQGPVDHVSAVLMGARERGEGTWGRGLPKSCAGHSMLCPYGRGGASPCRWCASSTSMMGMSLRMA